MDSTSFLEVPRPPYYCEPCFLILFGEKPPARPSPFDQTPCSRCSKPVGGMFTEIARMDSELGEDWVPVDQPGDFQDLGKDDWDTVEYSEVWSSSDEGARATSTRSKRGKSKSKSGAEASGPSSPAVSPLAVGIRAPNNTRLNTPALSPAMLHVPADEPETREAGPSAPQTPTVVVTDADQEDADARKPRNEGANESAVNANARVDPVTPGLRLPGKFGWTASRFF
ncbi:hypothetical protein F5Y05DRAFT_418025 [Hypoxylon sp. FL0543]|nr:hypothetical protein F5Y05DRAFT_418025 [Hypoxylon sp. FL0543]